MSERRDRAASAKRQLAQIGIDVEVECAGPGGEIAVIRAADGEEADLLAEVRGSAVQACRAAGFQYVSLALY